VITDIGSDIPYYLAVLYAGFKPLKEVWIALQAIVFLDPLGNVGVILQHPDSVRKHFHCGEKTGISELADTTSV
jgi:hypothetical protein